MTTELPVVELTPGPELVPAWVWFTVPLAGAVLLVLLTRKSYRRGR